MSPIRLFIIVLRCIFYYCYKKLPSIRAEGSVKKYLYVFLISIYFIFSIFSYFYNFLKMTYNKFICSFVFIQLIKTKL